MLNKQQFSILYSEFINDDNLIKIALKNIKELNINYIDLIDIYYYILIFRDYYLDYQSDIINKLDKFIKNNNLLIHTPSDKYIVNDKILDIDLSDIYNHYHKIGQADELFKIYLKEKYSKGKKEKHNKKIYRHTKLLI